MTSRYPAGLPDTAAAKAARVKRGTQALKVTGSHDSLTMHTEFLKYFQVGIAYANCQASKKDILVSVQF